MFRQAGIVAVRSQEELVDTLIAFWRDRLDLYLVGIQNSAPPETPGEMTPRDVAA